MDIYIYINIWVGIKSCLWKMYNNFKTWKKKNWEFFLLTIVTSISETRPHITLVLHYANLLTEIVTEMGTSTLCTC